MINIQNVIMYEVAKDLTNKYISLNRWETTTKIPIVLM